MRFPLVLILSVGSVLGQARSDYDPVMRQGRNALMSRHYGDAVSAFQRAVDLAPASVIARISLADALLRQYDPGVATDENLAIANRSKAEYLHVLELEPRHSIAAVSIGILLFGQASGADDESERMRLLEESREWYRRAVAIDPRNREAFYAMGRFAWLRWYPDYQGSLFW